MKKIFGSLIILFSIVSCQDVVQVKLDEGSKLYVVDAFVNDLRSPQTIRVITSDNYFSDREAPAVSNASVILKDLTANRQFAFSYTGDGNYTHDTIAGDTIAKVGHQYELDVTIDGQVYTSVTIQKRTAKIDSISAEYTEGGTIFGQHYDAFYSCTLWALDKVDANTDYYWVKTFRNDTLFSRPGDLNICIDGTQGPTTSASADSLNFTPPAIWLGGKGYIPNSNSTCKVEIHSLSATAYDFLSQAYTQVNNGGLFAVTPQNVKTNIVTPSGAKIKAVGWFNMATVASKKRMIP